MGALPKRKVSKGRRDRRRNHYRVSAVALIPCDNCGEMKLPHRVCKSCGVYKSREIFEVEPSN